MEELNRARHYLSQATALIGRARADLPIGSIAEQLANLAKQLEANGQHSGHIPDDARTALHQTSLALVNVRGSLIACRMVGLANAANDIRGEIIDWFDANDE